MDTLIAAADRPIYVDLDGTLVRSDLLWETLFLFARQQPLGVWRVPFWALQSKARLKAELAARTDLDPATLPYREEVVGSLQVERERGRRIILATAANERVAHLVADHLQLFDGVIASDEKTNLSSDAKLARIHQECGEAGFEYFGNSRDDLCLFDAAERATVVQPDRMARRWHERSAGSARLIAEKRSLGPDILRAMRPHQWMKNLLVFVPIALNQEYFSAGMLVEGLIAFLAFSLAASSVYILNDLLDLAADRRHKTKRHRPFASGRVPIPVGLLTSVGALAAAFGLSLLLPLPFLGTLLFYLVATTAYSVALKRMLLIDVLALAGLYTTRIIAGAAAAQTDESFWLLAFSIFFFLSLALVKRFTELKDFGVGANRSTTGRGYVDEDMDTIAQAGMASGFSSVLVLALYIDSIEIRELYTYPYLIWPLCPLVLYIIVRIWILARRGQMHDDPVVFILRDWRSQIMIAAGAALLIGAAYV